jgi:hypothetical protein
MAAIALGVVSYFLGWVRHDALGTTVGTWSGAAPGVRRVFRVDGGPLFAATLALQVWALLMVIGGVAVATNAGTDNRWLGSLMIGIVIVAALWGLLALTSFLVTRRQRPN